MSAVLATLGALLLLSGVTAGPAAADQPAKTWPSNAWWYKRLDLQNAWRISQGSGVTVAVLDIGVQADVGDLQGQILPGHVVTGQGGDARTEKPDQYGAGHGTYIATLIAGTGRGAGLVGVAPKAKILPVGVCKGRSDDDTCDIEDVAAGIRWAADHGADVVNISLQVGVTCTADLQSAITEAYRRGVLVVAATGNDRGRVNAPADCVGSIAVGAEHDGFVAWSGESHGPELDFVAPGVDMPEATFGGKWGTSDGTSNSAALVSGQFALLKSKFPDESSRDLVTRMLWNVHNGPMPGFAKRIDDKLGYGEPLPYYALTWKFRKNAANPIYDRIDAWMASHQSSSAPSASAPSGPTTHSDGNSSEDDSASDSSSYAGVLVALVVGVVVLILILALIVLLVVRGSNRNRPRGPMPPMPPPPPYRP